MKVYLSNVLKNNIQAIVTSGFAMGALFRQLIIYLTQYHTELREELQSIRTSNANWYGVRSLGLALLTPCLIIPLTTGKDINVRINDKVMGAIVLDHDATVISAVALRST